MRLPTGPLQGNDQLHKLSWQLINSPYPALQLYFEPSDAFSEGMSLTYWQFEFYSKERPPVVAAQVGEDVGLA